MKKRVLMTLLALCALAKMRVAADDLAEGFARPFAGPRKHGRNNVENANKTDENTMQDATSNRRQWNNNLCTTIPSHHSHRPRC